MAVSSLISASGVLPVRPPETLTILPARGRTASPEAVRPEERPDTRDLSAGLGPRERRRIALREDADRVREQVRVEESRRQLNTVREDLNRLRDLAQQAVNLDVPPEERTNFETQARELAGRIGSEPRIGDQTAGPEVVSFASATFQPGTLGLVEVNRAASDGSTDMRELHARATAALQRVSREEERTQVRLEETSRAPLGFRTAETTPVQEENPEETLQVVRSADEAERTARMVQEHSVTAQGIALIHRLAALPPEAVLALIP